MNTMDLVTEQSRSIKLNGKSIEVCIEIHTQLEEDTVEGDFDFGTAEENAAYLKRFHDGELDNVCIRVQASFEGVVGSDYLGMCHVNSNHKFSSDVLDLVNDHGMIDNAIRDLKTQLKTIIKKAGA